MDELKSELQRILFVESLETHFQIAEFSRQDFLVKANEHSRKLFMIKSGAVRAYVLDDAGNELTIRLAYPGDFITAMDSFLTGKETEFYLQAIKETTCLFIHKNQLDLLINSNPSYQKLWRQTLEQLIVQQVEREIDILSNSPKDRYLRLMKRSPHVFQEIPSKYIASYLRMTPETLSRLKKEKS